MYESINDLAVQIVIIIGISLTVTAAFVLYMLIRIRLKLLDQTNVIELRQKYTAVIISVYLWGLLPVPVGTILWIVSFFAMKYKVFATDSLRLEEYEQAYWEKEKDYPKVENIRQWRQAFITPTLQNKPNFNYGYSFGDHACSAAVLPLFATFNIIRFPRTSFAEYAVCVMITATALFMISAMISYSLSRHKYDGFIWKCIPIVIWGAVYYAVLIWLLTVISKNF